MPASIPASENARPYTDGELNSAVDRLANQGYLEYRGFFPGAVLVSVNRRIDVSRGGKPGFANFIAGDVAETVDEIRAYAPFGKIEALAGAATLSMHANFPRLAVTPGEDASYHVLRCADAQSDAVAFLHHYDSFLMTILISLQTSPHDDANGDLVIYPNHRRVPRSLVNVVQKAGTKVQQVMPVSVRKNLTLADLRSQRAVRVRAVAGDVFVFNGLVSMHCNLNVAAGERRSLLIHDCDPQLAFGITDILRSWRRQSSALATPRP